MKTLRKQSWYMRCEMEMDTTMKRNKHWFIPLLCGTRQFYFLLHAKAHKIKKMTCQNVKYETNDGRYAYLR